jgi:hypothetical protein
MNKSTEYFAENIQNWGEAKICEKYIEIDFWAPWFGQAIGQLIIVINFTLRLIIITMTKKTGYQTESE